MRVLFLSNFFPPQSRGGYEQWCCEVAEGLRQRGHVVTVLTSRHSAGVGDRAEPAWVRRVLHLEMPINSLSGAATAFLRRKRRERENLAVLQQTVDETKPEAVVIWGMWNLPRSLAARAEALLPGRTIYYIGDYWPTQPPQFINYWQAPAQHGARALPKRLLRGPVLWALGRETQPVPAFEHGLFPSQFMAAELARLGVTFKHAAVIPGGVAANNVLDSMLSNAKREPREQKALLYVGRLEPEKGVHTALEALALLKREPYRQHARLTLVGEGPQAYRRELERLASELGIGELVTFAGQQSPQAVTAHYRKADALLFTSIWPEPFGRVLAEAMLAALPIVGSPVGGAAELLREGQTALTFPAGDAKLLAAQVAKLLADEQLARALAITARSFALGRHTCTHMVQGIEAYLTSVVEGGMDA